MRIFNPVCDSTVHHALHCLGGRQPAEPGPVGEQAPCPPLLHWLIQASQDSQSIPEQPDTAPYRVPGLGVDPDPDW